MRSTRSISVTLRLAGRTLAGALIIVISFPTLALPTPAPTTAPSPAPASPALPALAPPLASTDATLPALALPLAPTGATLPSLSPPLTPSALAVDCPAPLAFVRDNVLWVVRPGEEPRRVILNTSTSVGSPRFLDSAGESIIFSAHRLEGVGTNRRGINLRVADIFLATSQGVRTLTSNTYLAIGPDISRISQDIIFVSNRHVRQRRFMPQTTGTELYLLRYPWLNPERLTTVGGSKFDPVWAPDGTRAAYLLSHGDSSGVYMLNLATRRSTLIARGANQPTWRPDGKAITYCRNGRLFEVAINGTSVSAERYLLPDDPKIYASFPRWTDYGLLYQWSNAGQEGLSLYDPASGLTHVIIQGSDHFGAADLAPREP